MKGKAKRYLHEGDLPGVHLDQPHGVDNLSHHCHSFVRDGDHLEPQLGRSGGNHPHDRVEEQDDHAAHQGWGPNQIDGVDDGEEEHERGADEEAAVDDGVLDPLVVGRGEGDELTKGSFVGRGQPQKLGVATVLNSR